MSDKEIEDLKAREAYFNSISHLNAEDTQAEIAWQVKRIADASAAEKPAPVLIFNSGPQRTEIEIDTVIKALMNLEKRNFTHI
jgi:hypothetical protein